MPEPWRNALRFSSLPDLRENHLHVLQAVIVERRGGRVEAEAFVKRHEVRLGRQADRSLGVIPAATGKRLLYHMPGEAVPAAARADRNAADRDPRPVGRRDQPQVSGQFAAYTQQQMRGTLVAIVEIGIRATLLDHENFLPELQNFI